MPEVPRHRTTFRRLLGFLRPYKWSLVVSSLLAVGSQLAAIAITFLIRAAINGPLTDGSLDGLWLIVALVIGIGLVKSALMLGRRLIAGRQALGVEFDIRNALYAKLVRQSFGFFDRNQTGQLMSRATVDLQSVRFFLGYGLIFFFQHIVTVVVVTSVLFIVNWKLALVALWIMPVLIALAYRYSHVSHPVLREVQQKMADVATVSEENIVGVHVVKSFAQEERERDAVRRFVGGGVPPDGEGEQAALDLRADDGLPAAARAGGGAARRRPHGRERARSRWARSSSSTSSC